MTTAANPQIVPREPTSLPALRVADRGVADALESVLSDNTRRVYGAQWRLFESWCGDVDLRALPAEPLTVARYLATRAARPPSPSSKSTTGRARLSCKDRGVRGFVINSAGIDRIDGIYNKTGERNGVRGIERRGSKRCVVR